MDIGEKIIVVVLALAVGAVCFGAYILFTCWGIPIADAPAQCLLLAGGR